MTPEMLSDVKRDIAAGPTAGTKYLLTAVLSSEPDYIDDVLAMDPFPTGYRAAVYEVLLRVPGGGRERQLQWAGRVLKAGWLVPARFQKILARTTWVHPDVLVALTGARQFKPRHIMLTLATRTESTADDLRAAYRRLGPEFAAVVDVYDGLLVHNSLFGQHFRLALKARQVDAIARLYGKRTEGLSLDEAQTLCTLLGAPNGPELPTFGSALELAALVAHTTSRPVPLRLPKPELGV